MKDTKKETKLVPKLRFKEFDEEWVNLSIKDLINKRYIEKPLDGNHGNIHPKSSDYVKVGIPFVMANNISNGRVDVENSQKIAKSQADSLQKGFAKEGDVLLTHKGSVGLTAIVQKLETPYIMLTPQVTYYRVDNTEQLSNEFLYQYFNTQFFKKDLLVRAESGTRPYIGITEQQKVKLSLPSLPEQQKIASFLTAVDKRIEQLTKKKKLLEEYKKGVMQKIFNQEIRFKDENGNVFPEWEEKRLGEFIEQRSERNSERSITNVLSVNNKLGFIPQASQFDNRSVASNDLSNYKIVRKNYYAYNPSRINVGSIARLKTTNCGVVSPMYVVFEINKNMSPNYFDILIQTHRFKHLVIVGCTGSVRDSLNIDDMKDFRFKVPKLEEQNHISEFFMNIEISISTINTLLAKAEKYKKGLLQQMFI